jgi:hypothetical protein
MSDPAAEDPGPNLEEVRKRLLRLASAKGKRKIGTPPDRPSDWRPAEVRQADGCGFTEPAAWDLIIELLGGGCELCPVRLEKPRGRVAYSITVQLPHGVWVYIKLEIGDGDRWIYGRSFHPPEHHPR